MTRFVTLNQFVNLWECDENDHMNVQFYFSKFEDAAALFQICHGLGQRIGKLEVRHVRYHSELRGGAQIHVESSLVHDPSLAGIAIQHVMKETPTGRIAATCLDLHEPTGKEAAHTGSTDGLDPAIMDDWAPQVRPRGITNPVEPSSPQRRGAAGMVISRGIVHPHLCTSKGLARHQLYIGAVSDAAAHAWDRVGISTQWLEKNGFGRVAVEMRLCVRDPMAAGTAYALELAFTGVGARAFTKCYDFVDLQTGAHRARLESAVMLLNHTTRKSEPLPDFVQKAIQTHLIP